MQQRCISTCVHWSSQMRWLGMLTALPQLSDVALLISAAAAPQHAWVVSLSAAVPQGWLPVLLLKLPAAEQQSWL